jgi:hypothetical protein
VAELEDVLASGVTDVVVGWPALWWMDHLPGLQPTLERWAATVRDDGKLRVYSLGDRADRPSDEVPAR